MSKKNLATIALIILFFGGYEALSFAQGKDCIDNNDRRYPDGTVIGDYQCRNGRWVRIR